MTASVVFSKLAVYTLSNLVLQHTSSFITSFEQVNYEIVFSLKYLLRVFVRVVDYTFYNGIFIQGGLNKKEIQLNLCNIFYFDI